MTDHSARVRASLADRYTIERELGRGGMATVYLARDLKHDRLVAVKRTYDPDNLFHLNQNISPAG